MKRTVLIIGLVVLTVGLLVAGCAKTPVTTPTGTSTATATATQPVKVTTWKFTSHLSPGPSTFVFMNLFEAIKRKTNGRLLIDRYWNQTLVNQNSVLVAVGTGLAECGQPNIGLFPGQLPLTQAMGLPYIGGDISEGDTFGLGWNNAEDKSPDMKAEYDALNLIDFGAFHNQANQYMGKVKVQSVADLKGVRLRVQTGVEGELVSLIGAVPLNTTLAEVYTGLQTGILDGTFKPAPTMYSQRLGEVVKYYTTGLDVGYATTEVIMNKDSYNALPADIQTVLRGLRQDFNRWCDYFDYEAPEQKKLVDDYLVANKIEILQFLPGEKAKMQAFAPTVWASFANRSGGDKAQRWLDLVKSEMAKVNTQYPGAKGTGDFDSGVWVFPKGWAKYVDLGYDNG